MKRSIVQTPLYIIVVAGLLFSLMGLSEFYNIQIAGHESAYPFGAINENQWYYQNATVYSTYNLISGLLFLLTFIISAWATIKKNRKTLLMSIGTTGILLLASFLSMGMP